MCQRLHLLCADQLAVRRSKSRCFRSLRMRESHRAKNRALKLFKKIAQPTVNKGVFASELLKFLKILQMGPAR